MNLNYPIKFHPILKDKIWGGDKLSKMLGKKSERTDIGESWEISDIKDSLSIVANGKLKGHSLQDLMVIYRGDFLGKKVFRKFSYNFPLLIKFIDAKEALSIQLHPNDTLAKERHNSFGKTEMWYVMQADKDANLIVGFKEDIDKQTYLAHMVKKSLLDILNVDKVKKGDVYFIPTGRVHAIGAGVLLAEIQQTSDITYRVYDWDRQDEYGNYRDLHTADALEAIDYKGEKKYKTSYDKPLNKTSNIVDCQYFTTNIIPILAKKIKIDHSDKDSFVIYMCVHGRVEFVCNKEVTIVEKGETVLIPAMLKKFSIKAKNKAELLEVYIDKDSPILEDNTYKRSKLITIKMSSIYKDIEVIAFDADDTLWINETYFREAEVKFAKLLAQYETENKVDQELFKKEMENLELYGYGVKGFVLSMVESALEISNYKVDPKIIEQIISIGKDMIEKPIELLDDVKHTLTVLSSKYKLILATKGDLLDQERKLEKSGLLKHFHHIEVLSEKKPENYKRLLAHLDVAPSKLLMVGNSLKSDILPIVEIGAQAIHIPFHTTWGHEVVKHNGEGYKTVRKLSDILSLL